LVVVFGGGGGCMFLLYEHVSGRRSFLMLGVVGEDRTLRLTAGSSNFLFLFFSFFLFQYYNTRGI
jgi:hypothetical protein